MPEIPDDKLVAYLDGELDARTTRAMEKRLSADPKLRARADAIRKTWDLLDFLPQPDPSPSFTTRTLDKIAILKPAKEDATKTAADSPKRATTAFWQSNLWPRLAIVVAAAAAVFLFAFLVSGSVGRKQPPPPVPQDELIAQDLRVLDNLNLYQYGEDLNFLLGLDQPDLFGDDATGR